MISPEDLTIACSKLNETSSRFIVKSYASGVKTIQSRKLEASLTLLGQFNEDTYYKKIAEALSQTDEGLSSIKLAERMQVNVALMKEHIMLAEEKGFVCRDESFEGVLWFPNKILASSA